MNYDTSIVDVAIVESLKYIAKDDYMSRLRKQLSALQRLHTKVVTTTASDIKELTTKIHQINESNYKKDFVINKDVFERIVDTTNMIIKRMGRICTMVVTKDMIDSVIVEELNDSITSKYTILTTNDLLTDIEHHKPISVKGLHTFLTMIANTHTTLVTTLETIIKKLDTYIANQTKILDSFTNDISTHSDYYTGLGNNLSVYVHRYKDSIRSIELFIKSTDVCIGNLHVLTSAISKHIE